MKWITHTRRYSASQAASSGATGSTPAAGSGEATQGDTTTTTTAETTQTNSGQRWSQEAHEEIRKARDERASARQERDAAKAELDAVKARLEAIETKDLGEQEKQLRRIPTLEAELKAKEAEAEKATETLARLRVNQRVERVAGKAGELQFADTEDAITYLNRAALEYDDEGNPTDKSVEAELTRILAAKPHLKATAAQAEQPAENTPSLPNPNGRGSDTEAERMAKANTGRLLNRNRGRRR